ncbi:MAG: hypothetical protein DRH08_07940, partial [Deltaproteobacteria bacterium]
MTTSIKDVLDAHAENALLNLHTALPGIITIFDPATQMATVQLAIKRIVQDEEIIIAPLLDVPVMQPSAGGFHVTMPITNGDECLVVFSERAIDNWVTSGGIQKPIEYRHHNISDAFAIIGVNSNPNAIPDYNPGSLQLRNEAGDQSITLNPDNSIVIDTTTDVIVNSATTTVNSPEVEVNATNTVINTNTAQVEAALSAILTTPNTTINSTVAVLGSLSINGIVLETHTHDQGGDSDNSEEVAVDAPRNP